jgi:hypothetical protein
MTSAQNIYAPPGPSRMPEMTDLALERQSVGNDGIEATRTGLQAEEARWAAPPGRALKIEHLPMIGGNWWTQWHRTATIFGLPSTGETNG